MGTTVEKATKAIQSISEIQQGINNLGGSLTDQTPLDEFRAELDDIYDKFPKTSYAEGTEITLSNTLKGKLDFENDIVGYGQTEQKSYEGYNLVGLVDGIYKSGGITVVVENGKATISGTTTSLTVVPINIKDSLTITNGETYSIYGFNSTSNSNMAFRPISSNGGFQVDFSTTNNVTSINFNASTVTITTVGIRVASGVTVNDVVCYPMLIIGSDTTKSYEPYVGGTASPNPSYPQEIEVVRGKNLAQLESEGRWRNFGTGEWNYSGNFNSFIAKVEPNMQYYASNVHSNLCYLDKDKNYIKGFRFEGGGAFNTIGETNIAYVSVAVENSKKDSIQLEKGSQATSYLPYNTLEIEERGKNLLNTSNITTPITSQGITITPKGNGSFELKGIATANVNFILGNYDFKKGTDYTISDGLSDNAYGKYTILIPTYQAWGNNTIINGKSTTFEAKSSDNFNITMVIYNGTDISSGITIYPQLEQGSTATDYEPYQEPKTYQLSLGEYEFTKIGNYVDTIEYDVDEDKVYKNEAIGKYQFTGNEIFGKSGVTNLNGYIFNFPSVTTNILPPANNTLKANILSNAFITKAVDSIISEATYGIGIRSDKYLYIGTLLGSFENVSELQTYLANNITFMYYALITPVKKEITGTLKDQIKAWYNSQSFTGTTIITSNGDLPMIIKARALKNA